MTQEREQRLRARTCSATAVLHHRRVYGDDLVELWAYIDIMKFKLEAATMALRLAGHELPIELRDFVL